MAINFNDYTEVFKEQKLTGPQIEAVKLLVSTGKKVKASIGASVPLRTIFRWCKEDDAFREVYDMLTDDMLTGASNMEPMVNEESRDYLLAVMRGETIEAGLEPHQVQAARINAAKSLYAQTKETMTRANQRRLERLVGKKAEE